MADVAEPTERVILPLPPPLQGALTAGPYNFQFTGEDNLRLSVVNSVVGVVVAVHFRTAPTPTTTQTNREFHTPTSDRLVTTKEFAVGTGYLLNVASFASAGAPKRCQTWVKLEVIRGMGANAVVLGAILQGFVTANQVIAWPGSPMESSTDGDGYLRVISGTTPTPAQEFAEVVPTGARWEVVSFRALFTPSAAAGNRTCNLDFLLGADILISVSPASLVAASEIWTFTWAPGLFTIRDPSFFRQTVALPTRPLLLSGSLVKSDTGAMQAGDQWSVIRYEVREWLEP